MIKNSILLLFFLSQFAGATAKPQWGFTEHSQACTAFLEGYADAVQEAVENPFGFAREFRAYHFPNEGDRVALALVAFTQGRKSVYNGQWIELFRLSRESDRVLIFRAALAQRTDVMLNFLRFEISDPKYIGLIISDLTRSKRLLRELKRHSFNWSDFKNEAVLKLATEEDRAKLFTALAAFK